MALKQLSKSFFGTAFIAPKIVLSETALFETPAEKIKEKIILLAPKWESKQYFPKLKPLQYVVPHLKLADGSFMLTLPADVCKPNIDCSFKFTADKEGVVKVILKPPTPAGGTSNPCGEINEDGTKITYKVTGDPSVTAGNYWGWVDQGTNTTLPEANNGVYTTASVTAGSYTNAVVWDAQIGQYVTTEEMVAAKKHEAQVAIENSKKQAALIAKQAEMEKKAAKAASAKPLAIKGYPKPLLHHTVFCVTNKKNEQVFHLGSAHDEEMLVKHLGSGVNAEALSPQDAATAVHFFKGLFCGDCQHTLAVSPIPMEMA
jgi:hypothetical protein